MFNTKLLKYASIPVLIAGVFAFVPRNQDDKDGLLLQYIVQGLEMRHYERKPIDDSLANRVFHEYLESLDNQKRFLLQSDVDELSKYKYQIDDEFQKGTHVFLIILTWIQ